MKALVLLGLMVAAPVAAADQFDLICRSGTTSQHYRLDLSRMEYCWDRCERVVKIHDATSGMITLSRTEPKFRNDEEEWNTINRTTGEWEWFESDPSVSSHVQDIKGTCEPAPFGGLPAPKF